MKLILLGRGTLREVLPTDVMDDVRRTAVALSRYGSGSGFERGYSTLDAASIGVEPVNHRDDSDIFLLGHVVCTKKAVGKRFGVYRALEGNDSGDTEERDADAEKPPGARITSQVG